MPYLIEEACFSRKLELAKENYKTTKSLLLKGVADYKLDGLTVLPGYRFVKSLSKDQYHLIFKTEEGSWITLYAVKLIYRNDVTYPKMAATQVMVWRMASLLHKQVLDNLPHLFFMHILAKANIVISDTEQTIHGQRFWKKMLEWAFYNQYHIYVSDGTKGEDWPKYKVYSYEELCSTWESYVWGNDKNIHLHRLLIISKDIIEEVKFC